jgi:oxygen-independent coproporphyrinogen-3 oxidase
MQTKEALIEALCTELNLKKHQQSIHTIYFGGGTPSILSASELNKIFASLHAHYNLHEVKEITLEANPDDITTENLTLWKSLGIDRLSIGCQTFNNSILQALNREHSAEQASNAILQAQAHGFLNMSIDLMFGLPHQTMDIWKQDIEKALSFKVPHISTYGLTIEEKTVFGHQHQKGILKVPNENDQALAFEYLMDTLCHAGYIQYEVSNFALPGFESKHNSAYWQHKHYIGIGPSAHSYNGIERRWNIANNALYMKALQQNNPFSETEILSDVEKSNEYILTSLRTIEGLNVHTLIETYNYPESQLNSTLAQLEEKQYIQNRNGNIVLTRKGILLADEITLKLLLN